MKFPIPFNIHVTRSQRVVVGCQNEYHVPKKGWGEERWGICLQYPQLEIATKYLMLLPFVKVYLVICLFISPDVFASGCFKIDCAS